MFKYKLMADEIGRSHVLYENFDYTFNSDVGKNHVVYYGMYRARIIFF